MDANQQSLKNPSKIALAALGVLLVGAIVFYKERLFFADTSFIAFNIINYKNLQLIHERFGGFITHIIPYIGQELNLPISTILIGYAISFNLFFLSIAAILVYKYKQYGLAVLMALYYFLIASDSYFLLCSEIHQAVAWMFLFFAVTLHLGKKKVNIFLLLVPFLLLAFLTISTHFIVIIPTVFLWVYFIIDKENWPFSKNNSILLSCLLAAIIAFQFIGKTADSYDDTHLQGITHFSLKQIIGTFSTPVIQMFFYRCLVNYWLAAIIFITGIVSLVKSKKKILACWALISCLGYLILMGLTYGDQNKNVMLFHIETEWECLGIIIAAPFVFSFLPNIKPSFAMIFLAIIFFTRLVYIGIAIPAFSWRTQFKDRVMAQMKKKGITKLALYKNPELMSKCILDWAIPYETIMLSAMNGEKPQSTFFLINPDDKITQEDIKNPKGFYDAFDLLPVKNLNRKYFIIDSTHPYEIMTYDELFK